MVTHPLLQNAGLGLRYLVNRIVEDRLNASAAALTFVSLFALVPLLTVTLVVVLLPLHAPQPMSLACPALQERQVPS